MSAEYGYYRKGATYQRCPLDLRATLNDDAAVLRQAAMQLIRRGMNEAASRTMIMACFANCGGDMDVDWHYC